MPPDRSKRNEDDYIVEHPNRKKKSSKATKAVVTLLILVSAGLLIVIAFGGWSKMVGAKPLLIVYILLYFLLAFFVFRWQRGVLPVISALAIILLIFAGVSVPGWYDRGSSGFADTTLPPEMVALLCFILIPVQILLIAFAMRGFQQEWNVEVERKKDDVQDRGDGDDGGGRRGAAAAPA